MWMTALAMVWPVVSGAQPLTVSAAASLTDAFRELATHFQSGRPGVQVRFNFAASGALIQQVAQGAPVDVLATADQETMDRAARQQLVSPASRRNFASNELVLVEPAMGGTGIRSLQDLTRPQVRRIAVGKASTVPAGRYTQQALQAAGLWVALEPRLIHADSVRQVLDYVGRGEVDAGFVYRTDAAAMAHRVKVVLRPALNHPITYPVAVVADSRQQPLAQAFVAFLESEVARQVLVRHGFGPP